MEKDGLEQEDKARALYTNLKVVGEKLDYPRFGGTDGEDYSKFYETIVKALTLSDTGGAETTHWFLKMLPCKNERAKLFKFL